MKLFPKAKPIRIRIVSGGEEHSSIETLRNNYSLKDIHPLVNDGRLYKWLIRVGESKATEVAYRLIGSNTNASSKDMVELTAAIFNTTAKSIEDLLNLWERKYPKAFFNYIKEFNDKIFPDIISARKSYDSIMVWGEVSGITEEEWKTTFVKTLKKMPLLAVIEYFNKFKSIKPMDDIAWLKVLKYHSDSASDMELYVIAQAAYEYPYLKDEAVEWYLKSAQSYIKAKEWVNKNLKRLDPKEKELFDTFERNPSRFARLSFDKHVYPKDLISFLNALSTAYSSNQRIYMTWNTKVYGKYSKYILIIEKLYDIVYWSDKLTAVKGLKHLSKTQSYTDYFRDYKTLDRIIYSLEKEEQIFGIKLWEQSYQKTILFIAGLAKAELENEK